MIFFFVIDPEEGKSFPELSIPADLGPDSITVMGSTVTDAQVKAAGASSLSIDPDAPELLVLDSNGGDLFAYFFIIPAIDEVIAVMPNRPFNDVGAKIVFSYDCDSHFLNNLQKVCPTVRLTDGTVNRTISSRGTNFIPMGTYTVDKVYAPLTLADVVEVTVDGETGISVCSDGIIDLTVPGLYVMTVGGKGETFFPVTDSVIPTGFKYLINVG